MLNPDVLAQAIPMLEQMQELLEAQRLLLQEGVSFDAWQESEENKKNSLKELEKLFPKDFPLDLDISAQLSGHAKNDLVKFKSLARSVNDLNNVVGQLIQLRLRQTQAAINVLRSSANRSEAVAEYGQDRRITGVHSSRRLLMSG